MTKLLPIAPWLSHVQPSPTPARRSRWNFLMGLALGSAIAVTYQSILSSPVLSSFDVSSSRSLAFTNPTFSAVYAKKETFHVIFGLMGQNKALYDAWEVALKSVLVNAPTDADVQIHLLCNQDAHRIVKEKISAAKLVGSRWRNQVTITSYNVDAFNDTWRRFLQDKLQSEQLYERVSLGGYYRLLAHKVLSGLDIGPALYMDTDVVILSNLNNLMQSMDETKIFQGSKSFFCSGFVVVNVNRFDEFWEKVDQLDMDPMPVADQDIMLYVMKKFPETFGKLPKEWDRNLGNGWRRKPHELFNQTEAAGMLHFQGGTGRRPTDNYFTRGFSQYCWRTPVCRGNDEYRDAVKRTWGLADYYVRLTWKWAKYFGKSTIRPNEKGYKLDFRSFTAKGPQVEDRLMIT